MGRRSKYPEEFRRNAAQLALDGGRSIRDVARELGVNHETLRNWVEALRRERRDGPAAVTGEDRAELARLRRRVAELERRRRFCEKPWSSSPGRQTGDPRDDLRVHRRGEDHLSRPSPIVGWAIADHLRRELVLDALGMALHQRTPAAGLIHHSDHGVQYTSIDFGRTLRASGLVASMGSMGDAFDNAMVESFFATLKEELIYRRAWPSRHELEMEVFSFIEGFYNTLRRHSRLGNLSPATYEQQLTTRNEVSG